MDKLHKLVIPDEFIKDEDPDVEEFGEQESEIIEFGQDN